MQAAIERTCLFVAQARTRNAKQMRSAIFIALLLMILLWWTQWPSLKPGIRTLVVGYLLVSGLRFRRYSTVGKELDEFSNGDRSSSDAVSWFDEEQSYSNLIMLVENGVRTVGFALLAYGFWIASGNTILSILLGVIYPVIAYFGIARANMQRTRRQLRTQRNEVETLLGTLRKDVA